MKIEYQQDQNLKDEIVVRVLSGERNTKVDRLLQYLGAFNQTSSTIPVKTADRFVIVKPADLVMVEVNQNELTWYPTSHVLKTNGHLKDIQSRLTAANFIQVSHFAIINMDFLQSMENGFSGTMVSKLLGGVKTSVSRKFVPLIKDYLGL